jgi:hypothetical protein
LHPIMLVTKQPSQRQAVSWFADLTHHPSRLSPSYFSLYNIQPFLLPQASYIKLPFSINTQAPHSLQSFPLPLTISQSQQYPAIRYYRPIYINPHKTQIFPPSSLQCIIDAMKAHPGNPDVNDAGCNAFGNLACDDCNQPAIAAAGGIMVC